MTREYNILQPKRGLFVHFKHDRRHEHRYPAYLKEAGAIFHCGEMNERLLEGASGVIYAPKLDIVVFSRGTIFYALIVRFVLLRRSNF